MINTIMDYDDVSLVNYIFRLSSTSSRTVLINDSKYQKATIRLTDSSYLWEERSRLFPSSQCTDDSVVPHGCYCVGYAQVFGISPDNI